MQNRRKAFFGLSALAVLTPTLGGCDASNDKSKVLREYSVTLQSTNGHYDTTSQEKDEFLNIAPKNTILTVDTKSYIEDGGKIDNYYYLNGSPITPNKPMSVDVDGKKIKIFAVDGENKAETLTFTVNGKELPVAPVSDAKRYKALKL